jgi:hypothetical protein
MRYAIFALALLALAGCGGATKTVTVTQGGGDMRLENVEFVEGPKKRLEGPGIGSSYFSTVHCPNGGKIISGGFQNFSQGTVVSNGPVGTFAWTVQLSLPAGASHEGEFQANAICAHR